MPRVVTTITYCQFCELGSCAQYCHGKRFKILPTYLPNVPKGSTSRWEFTQNLAYQLVRLREKGHCFICHRMPYPKETFEVHHLHHQQQGGTHNPKNLILVCPNCHSATYASQLEKAVQAKMEREKNDRMWRSLISAPKEGT